MKHTQSLVPKSLHDILIQNDPQEVQAAKISAEHKVKTKKPRPGTVAPAQSLRQRILSISLFPNPYNREAVSKYEKD